MHDRSTLGRIDTPDLHNRDSYTISDLSDEFGVTARALRFYEDEGLIAPEPKIGEMGTLEGYGRKIRNEMERLIDSSSQR